LLRFARNDGFGLRPRQLILPDGQIPFGCCRSPCCQALSAKIFCFTEYSEYPISFPSRPTKGALRNVNNAGRDAVDADGAVDDGA
jgi:hypothetical protein